MTYETITVDVTDQIGGDIGMRNIERIAHPGLSAEMDNTIKH